MKNKGIDSDDESLSVSFFVPIFLEWYNKKHMNQKNTKQKCRKTQNKSAEKRKTKVPKNTKLT
jgi:hypothetical protein